MPVLIRPATPHDAMAIEAIYTPFVLNSAATLEWEPPDAEEIERRLVSTLQLGFPYLAAEVDGVIAGYAYASQFRPRIGYRYTAEDSVYLRSGFAGRGLGRQMLGVLIEQCRTAGCHQMVAVICGENAASVRMHEALGFVDAGVLREVGFKFGRWQDVRLMQRAL